MKHYSKLFLLVLFIIFGCNNKCNKLKTKTIANLKTAYIIEVTDSSKYAAFAQQTRKEGKDRLSVFFLSVSKSKSITAHNIKAALKQLHAKIDTIIIPESIVKSTIENLNEANEKEKYVLTKLYPDFIKDAKEEGALNELKLFARIKEVENKDVGFINDAIDAIYQHWTNSFFTLYFICPVCGNIYYPDHAADNCSLCKTDKKKFIHKG